MSDLDPRDELILLTNQVRQHLEWLQRGGVQTIPAAPPEAEKPRVAVAERAVLRAPQMDRPAERPAPQTSRPVVAALTPGSPLAVIREHLGECTRCKLSEKRKQIVFGVGDPNAALVFVGEAPGADEDRVGEPFVGAAGQLLDRMIVAMGLSRAEVYIANIIKCRPPGNRNPEPDEIAACEPFLKEQLGAIKPRLIVCLGKFAAQTLLQSNAAVSSLRGQWKTYEGIPLMPTFHPAYLLRTPEAKRVVWDDLKEVMARMDELGLVRRR